MIEFKGKSSSKAFRSTPVFFDEIDNWDTPTEEELNDIQLVRVEEDDTVRIEHHRSKKHPKIIMTTIIHKDGKCWLSKFLKKDEK